MPVEVRDVRFGYNRRDATIVGATFSIADGEMVALVGPSGSGKSTLLQLLGRLLTPGAGKVLGLPDVAEIRWIFQTPTALGRRSALDNVRIGLLGTLAEPSLTSSAMAALAQVGLAAHASQTASTLSGGQLQRVQVARALLGAPRLVLADEPTAQLDRHATDSVVAALRIVRAVNSCVVVATHDPVVAAACDRRLAVRDGVVVEESG